MATIALTIAGRPYELACRNGEEAHLRRVAAIVDAKASDAARAMGGMSEARQMLFAALMLADELDEARTRLATQAETPALGALSAEAIERLAERIERISALLDAPDPTGLETPATSA